MPRIERYITKSLNFLNKQDPTVQYAAHYGNRSNQSCTAWNTAELYSEKLITQIGTQMINCSINCLNSSTYIRAGKIGWNCGKFPVPPCIDDFGPVYWVKDLYNGTDDYESRVSDCDPCECECSCKCTGVVCNRSSTTFFIVFWMQKQKLS